MKGWRAFVAAHCLCVAQVATAAPQGAAAPTEWNQPHGNAAGTAYVDVAPLKVPPTERWRFKTEQLLAGPVVSQGKVYFVVREAKARKLVVLEPDTGALLGKKTLDCTGDVLGLAVVDRLAVVVDPGYVRTYRFVGDTFKLEKNFAGTFNGEPTMVRDLVLVASGGGLSALDCTSGKSEVFDSSGVGRAAVTSTGEDEVVQHLRTGPSGAGVGIARGALQRDRSKSLVRDADSMQLVQVNGRFDPASRALVLFAATADPQDVAFWLGASAPSGIHVGRRAFEVKYSHPPAARDGRVYGFVEEGLLIAFDVRQGGYLPLVQRDELPKGAHDGVPSIARDVLYLGNWAVEIGSRRVLWCIDPLDPAGPAIPSGDEAFVVVAKDGTVIGYGNGPAPEKPAAPKGTAGATTAKSNPAPSAAAPAPVMPGTKPGVVRADGVYVAGKVTALENGRIRVEPEKGEPQEFAADAVAWAATGTDAPIVGAELPVYRACFAALSAQYVEVLLTTVQSWRKLDFFDDCRRLIEEAKRYGLAPARADELLVAIAHRKSTTAGNADVQRRHLLEVEAAARAKFAEGVVAASRWCGDHGAPTAATALRLRESDMVPGRLLDPLTIADWVPPLFPFPGDRAARARVWANWADPLLPTGARFVKADEALTKKIAKTPFSSGAAILETEHVLLISREFDPKILGPCLVRAEAAVRTVARLLGKSPSGARPDKRVEIRLYVTREEYLGDGSGSGPPPKWSAGVFSFDDGVSRFYSRLAADAEDPFGRSLHGVMAHELAHHYVHRIWDAASGPSAAPGFWMEEGFAEFIGEQAVEMDRLGDKLDDPTVRSLDLAAAALRVGGFIPLAVLLDVSFVDFLQVPDTKPFGPLQPRHTLFQCLLDTRGLFYVESAALTYFVMNRCGEDGRAAFLDWYRHLLRGQAAKEPWKRLGYATLADFEAAFRAFLQGI